MENKPDESILKWFEIQCEASIINDKYFVYTLPHLRNTIHVFDLTCKIEKPLLVHGHSRDINAFAINQKQSPCWLASFGSDSVKLWNLDLAFDCHAAGDSFCGLNLCSESVGCVNHACFSPDCDYVVCCVGALIKVFSTQNEEASVTMILEGHNADVNFCNFVPNVECPSEDLLVSLSDDRTFKVWHLEQQCLLYQSPILSPKYLSTFACHPDESLMVVADLAGKLHVIDMSKPTSCRESYKVNLFTSACRKSSQQSTDTSSGVFSDKPTNGPVTVSSRPSWQIPNSSSVPPEFAQSEEFSAGILAVQYIGWWPQNDNQSLVFGLGGMDEAFAMSDLREALSCSMYLITATYTELIILNAKTFEQSAVWNYKRDFELSHNVSSAFITSDSSYQVLLCLKDDSSSQLTLIVLKSIWTNLNIESLHKTVTFLSKSPIKCDSILNSCYSDSKTSASVNLKSTNRNTLRRQSVTKPAKRGCIPDHQPLTFKAKIPSSGYARVETKRELFKPQMSHSKKPMKKSSSASAALKSLTESYPLDYQIPTNKQKSILLDTNPSVINRLSFSGTGVTLACALSNNSCQLVTASTLKQRASLTGHNGRVMWCSWSSDNEWLITSSEDKTARIWSSQTGETVLLVNARECKSKDASIPVKSKPQTSELKSVSFAQFYFVDRFFYLICDSELLLYKYNIDLNKADIKRYQTHSKYKVVQSYSLTDSNRITCAASINRFYSHYIICAGSCKSVCILDLNSGQFITNIPEAHSRSVTSIAINQGSNFSSRGSSCYDVYATSAIGDSIKLWDLRTNKSIQRYANHSNRLVSINIDFSPCGRYLATGSEDRSAYIYDIRCSNVFVRLSGLSDTVTSASFHPAKPSIYAGCIDGSLSLFGDGTA